MNAKTIVTQEEKQALIDAGYTVEDMNKEHGWAYKGQYRWMNEKHEEEGDGFGVIQYSEDKAWADAKQFQEQQLGIPLFIPETDPTPPAAKALPHPGDLTAMQALVEVDSYEESLDMFCCTMHTSAPCEGQAFMIPALLLSMLIHEYGEPDEFIGRTYLVESLKNRLVNKMTFCGWRQQEDGSVTHPDCATYPGVVEAIEGCIEVATGV